LEAALHHEMPDIDSPRRMDDALSHANSVNGFPPFADVKIGAASAQSSYDRLTRQADAAGSAGR
jgi:hypothetical protein